MPAPVTKACAGNKKGAEKDDAKNLYECPVCIVESEIHMVQALEDVKNAGCNAPIKQLYNLGVEIEEHRGAVAFGHFGKVLYEVFKYIGVDVDEIGFNQPKGMRYPTENPFA